MSSVKRIVVTAIVFLVFLALLFAGIYLFLGRDPVVDEVPAVLPTPSLGLGNISVSQLGSQPFGEDFFEGEISSEDDRDDRVYRASLSGDADTGEAVETKENLPRLVRLFKGPTAGYRIDKNEDDLWTVGVVAQGRGGRYFIQTVPYSLEFVSRGEFTRVVEAYPFANGEVLVLYESADAEGVIRSSFVPFSTSETGTRIQRFEDNIRVATNNENLLFFIQVIDDKSVGVVVDVLNPEKTRVVWESDFTSWIPRWGRGQYITLHSPVTDFMKGYVYLVDPDGILPDNQFVSFSSGGSAFADTSSGFFILFETDANNFVGKASITNQKRDISIDLPITLPEKCDGFNGVFVCAVPRSIPSETSSGYETLFPDSWYQGDISFDDAIIMVNAVTGGKRLLMSPDQREIQILSGNETFDVIHPRISEDGGFLFFVNKRDMSLWMLRLGV